MFKDFGVDEAERRLKSNPEYQAVLLRGKTVNDFRRLLRGKINHFELRFEQVDYSRWEYTWDAYPNGDPVRRAET